MNKDEHVHAAIKKLFQLRAALATEMLRVQNTADAVAWNAIEVFSEHCKAIHGELTKHLDQATGDNEPLTRDSIEQELHNSNLRWTFSLTNNDEFYLFQRGSNIVLKKVKTRGDVRSLVRSLGATK